MRLLCRVTSDLILSLQKVESFWDWNRRFSCERIATLWTEVFPKFPIKNRRFRHYTLFCLLCNRWRYHVYVSSHVSKWSNFICSWKIYAHATDRGSQMTYLKPLTTFADSFSLYRQQTLTFFHNLMRGRVVSTASHCYKPYHHKWDFDR